MGADLAEQALEGLAPAPRYVTLEMTHAVLPVADIVAEDGRLASQLLHGEIFEILFRRAGRAYGRSRRDGTVGWVAEGALKSGAFHPAYRVRTHGGAYPFNALMSGGESGLDASALAPVSVFETDPVAVARTFEGMPVAVGERASRVDGIGLVQQVLFACGRAAPRRAVDLAAIGRAVECDALTAGDIVVWTAPADDATGHAAMVIEDGRIIHACPRAGQVLQADLADVLQQAAALGLNPPVLRRPAF